ncbi:MAG: glycoside hydrolase family 27 protein [Solirubrobacteraceae bacterium]
MSLRRAMVALLAGALAPLGAPSAGAFAQPSASQTPTVLAPTPYMGWDTYLALGPRINESIVLTQASRMISDGLQKAGYRYVWLDVGWWQGQRNSKGEIMVDPAQWPHGMKWLASTLHKAGFLVGLYTDAGKQGCGGARQGSYGHYQQDANTFAAWGFDAVKVDFCGGGDMHLSPAEAYGAFHQALVHNSSHRPMLLSICDFREPGQSPGEPPYDESAFTSYTFGPSDGNSWRTDTDVGFPDIVSFPEVLRNLDADAAHPEAAGPGHWNDPDYLAPDQGLSGAQFKTQLSMWAMVAAPLMVSDNLTTISPASLRALKNSEVLAIDQDPAGVQGKLLSTSGEGQVWVKPLYGGQRAVALLNVGSKAQRISTTAAAIGMPPAASYQLRNLWSHTTRDASGTISAEVPGESVVLLRVAAVSAKTAKLTRAASRRRALAASASAKATTHSHGLSLSLSVTPDTARPGAPVKVSLVAHTRSVNGAFGDSVSFGDGTSTPPVALPQYCLGGNAPAGSRTWHYTHRYRKRGTYRISASAYVNCSGEHATVSLTVHVE